MIQSVFKKSTNNWGKYKISEEERIWNNWEKYTKLDTIFTKRYINMWSNYFKMKYWICLIEYYESFDCNGIMIVGQGENKDSHWRLKNNKWEKEGRDYN